VIRESTSPVGPARALDSRLLAALALATNVVSMVPDLEAELADVLARVLAAAGLRSIGVHLAEDGSALRLAAEVGASTAADAAAGVAALCHEAMTIHTVCRSATATPGATLLATPIAAGAEVLGALWLTATPGDLAGDAWTAFARTLGVQLGYRLALDRARAGNAASERRWRALMDQANDAVLLADARGVLVEVNRRAEELLGRTREELLGRGFLDFVPAADRSEARRGFEATVTKARHRVTSGRFQHQDGNVIVRDISLSLVDVGPERRVLAIVHDSTEHLRAQEELRQRAAVASLGADINLAVGSSGTTEAFLQRCVVAVVEHLVATGAHIWTVGASGTMLELQATAGTAEGGAAPGQPIPVGEGRIGRIASTRKPDVARASRAEPGSAGEPWQESTRTGFAGHPLVAKGELLGVLAVHADAPLADVALGALEAVADSIAVGIDRRRVEHARASLEEQLRRADKLQAIGELAGGVAHDFNNMLAVIGSYTEMVMADLADDDPHREDLQEVRSATDRACALTRQLLAFGRRQLLQPVVLDVDDVVADMKRMFQRVLPENIELVTHGSTRSAVRADRGQLEQVVMNLVVNARDAMPDGGRLTIATSQIDLDASSIELGTGVTPGPHVALLVTDTGSGMSPEVRARIFEPFFTTKAVGRGTGLGLATVFGIVQQSGGHILVDSEPGRGTTIRIYLPALEDSPDATRFASTPSPSAGSETVLLVEDNDAVRLVAARILRQSGYRVVVAQTPDAAIREWTGGAHFDVLLTDLVMPGMDGRTLAATLAARTGPLRVLYMTGYAGDTFASEPFEPGTPVLEKPFTPTTLTRKLRDVLAAPPRSPI
jgi:two-component system, cell cycle sensor histidine kinase and response regulator CckA